MTTDERRVGSWQPAEMVVAALGLAAYVVLLLVGRSLVGDGDATDAQRWGFGAGTIAAALLTVGVAFRVARRSTEVDRVIVSEGTSLAFFITMAGALTYGLLESFLEVPRPSAWTVWMFGMGTWVLVGLVLRRRLL